MHTWKYISDSIIDVCIAELYRSIHYHHAHHVECDLVVFSLPQGALLTGNYGLWNAYVVVMLILYAPSRTYDSIGGVITMHEPAKIDYMYNVCIYKPVGWPWSGAVLFLSLWIMYKFGWCDVVACEARHARGVWGHAPP